MPMEYIVPSLRIATITSMADRGALEERLAQLAELEEEWFLVEFHHNYRNNMRKRGMIAISRCTPSRRMI